MSETGRDVEEKYIESPMGSMAPHKFVKWTEVNKEFAELHKINILENLCNYMLEVYMDN